MLGDPETGLLSQAPRADRRAGVPRRHPRRRPGGRRGQEVRGLLAGGAQAPFALTWAEGEYLDVTVVGRG